MVTVEDVRELALRLPRTTEALVRDRVKFRVGSLVYLAFSRDETVMGSRSQRTSAKRWSRRPPARSRCRAIPTCVTTGCTCVRLAAIDVKEMRELVLDAWRMVVPKRVAESVEERMIRD